MVAIVTAAREGRLKADVRVVVSPKDDTQAVEEARTLGAHVEVVPPTEEGYGEALLKALEGCDVVCLAGFTRLLPEEVLQAFPGKVLNIHPALLPKFGGKGMYGIRVHEAVLEAGESESGCSVHLVTERYDEGRVILQRTCPVQPGDTPETLAARVLATEHLAFVEALQEIADAR